jgi:hypothetical protein
MMKVSFLTFSFLGIFMSHTFQTFIKFIEKACAENSDTLLHPKFKKLKKKSEHPLFGLCYAASEAFYHLVKPYDLKVKPAQKKIFWRGEWISHWVVILSDGTVVDITAGQFLNEIEIPYSEFKGRPFYPQQSNACKYILETIKPWIHLLPKA